MYDNPVKITGDSSGRLAQIGPFGRLSTAAPFSIFESKLDFDSDPFRWAEHLEGDGSGAYKRVRTAYKLAVGTGATGRALRQSRTYLAYQPGKGQEIKMSFNMKGQSENRLKRVGYFDDNNGIFLEVGGSDVWIVMRSNATGSVVDTRVSLGLGEWNLDIPTRPAFDWNLTQILFIDMEWLGTGTVRVGMEVLGTVYWLHAFKGANTLPQVYIQTPNLPVRYEIISTGVGAATSMDQICSTVQSIGGRDRSGVTFAAGRIDGEGESISGILEPLVSIRLSAAGIRRTILPLGFQLSSTSNADAEWHVLYNATLGGAGPVWTATDDPAVEFDISADTVTGGTQLEFGYVSNNSDFASASERGNRLQLGADYAGVSDTLTLAARGLGGPETYYGAWNWLRES